MEILHTKLQHLNLLIAEDDPSTLKWLVRVLSIYFKKVYGASDAMEALEIFNNAPTDIVIADIQMPHVDGLHFLQKIASISPDTLRIVMTAFNNQAYLNRIIESEVNFYFKKPIDIDELLVAISSNITKTIYYNSNILLKEDYYYNPLQKNIVSAKESINLTKKESLLMELLLKNRNSIVSLEQIEESIWMEPVTNDAIRMIITGLRKKLYKGSIANIKGLGYKLHLD
jgi:DNA-binding response OmpR family regulator